MEVILYEIDVCDGRKNRDKYGILGGERKRGWIEVD